MVVRSDIPSALNTPRGSIPLEDDTPRSTFSNSWPEPKMFEDAGKPPKKKLDPISGAYSDGMMPYLPL